MILCNETLCPEPIYIVIKLIRGLLRGAYSQRLINTILMLMWIRNMAYIYCLKLKRRLENVFFPIVT